MFAKIAPLLVFVSLHHSFVSSHHIRNRIEVYYESICPDSRRFVLNQVVPAYDALESQIDLELIPFGNANVTYPNHDRKPFFQCQHGPDECYGNKAHACAVDLTKNMKVALGYIKCLFDASDWKNTRATAQRCAERSNINWDTLRECVDGPEGDRLLLNHSHRTFNLSPPKTSVPWLVIDGQHTAKMQSRSEKNLRSYLCQAYHNHEPRLPQCAASGANRAVASLLFFALLALHLH